jgi:hypothetical protein
MRTFRYQHNAGKVSPLENLKNRWADNDLTPFQFWLRYYRKYSGKSYREFLLDLNWYKVWTEAIKLGAEDFKKESR